MYFEDVIKLNSDNGDFICFEIEEITCFPHSQDIDGYSIMCTLKINAGCYKVEKERYDTSAGAFMRFKEELEKCYKNLCGKASFFNFYLENDDLNFCVEMTKNGHAIISGEYKESFEKCNCLRFEFKTDQTYILHTIEDLKRIQAKYDL